MFTRRSLATGAASLAIAAATLTGAAASDNFDVDAIVTAAAAAVREKYVDPVTAGILADRLLARLRASAYATRSRDHLARRLTADLRAWTDDLHMAVVFQPPTPSEEGPQDITEDNEHPRTTGRGVQTVARLQGNIGLLRVTHFPSPVIPRVAARYGAAMELLQETAALILDLTINHGGGEDTFGYFMSYFLDGEIGFGRSVSRDGPGEIIKTSLDALGPHYGEARPMFVAIS